MQSVFKKTSKRNVSRENTLTFIGGDGDLHAYACIQKYCPKKQVVVCGVFQRCESCRPVQKAMASCLTYPLQDAASNPMLVAFLAVHVITCCVLKGIRN